MNRHNLPLAWHAATDMSAIGWVMIANSSDCLISQEWLASIAESDSIINATLLYFTYYSVIGKVIVYYWQILPPITITITITITIHNATQPCEPQTLRVGKVNVYFARRTPFLKVL